MTKFPLMIVSIAALVGSVYADKSATQGWVTKNFSSISVSNKLEQVVEKVDEIEDNVERVDSNVTAVSNKTIQIEQDLSNVSNKVEEVSTDVDNMKSSLTHVSNKVETVSTDLETANTKIDSNTSNITSVSNKVEELETQATEAIEEMEERANEIEGKIDSLSNGLFSAESPIACVNVPDGSPMVVSNYNAKTGKWEVKEQQNFAVQLGSNTRNTASSGTHSQSIVIGRDARTSGSASVALGPNAEVDGTYGIAIGWRAAAIGTHGIAIGGGVTASQNYWTDDDYRTNKNVKANQCLAEGEDSIAIGWGAHATAKNSVQIGHGTNSTPNSLQFGNVKLLENGKVVGFDVSELDPKTIDVTEAMKLPEPEITVKPHVLNTLVSTTNLDYGTEVYLKSDGSRNYEVYVPNDAEFRAGLPLNFDAEIDNVKAVFVGGKQVSKLPVVIKVQQPSAKTVLFSYELAEDDYDWKPVVTNINVEFSGTAFKTISGKQTLEGYNLHNAKEYLLVYPTGTSVETPVTNTVFEAKSTGFISGTFFNATPSISVPVQSGKPLRWDGTSSWVELIYTTSFGTVSKRIELTLDL